MLATRIAPMPCEQSRLLLSVFVRQFHLMLNCCNTGNFSRDLYEILTSRHHAAAIARFRWRGNLLTSYTFYPKRRKPCLKPASRNNQRGFDMTNEKDPQVGVHLVGLLERNAAGGLEDLIDATPRAFRCEVATSCPTAMHSPASGCYALIGTTIAHEKVTALSARVGYGETAIELRQALLHGAVINTIKKEASALFIIALVIQLIFTLIVRPIKFLVALVSVFFIAVAFRPARYIATNVAALAVSCLFYPLRALGSRLPGMG